MGKKDRRFPRYQIELPVLLKDKRYTQEMITGDVSRHGVFLSCDSPKPIRQLVQLTIKLPRDRSIEVMGMVARAVMPEDEAKSGPGMGIDFFALSANAKSTWDEYILGMKDQTPEDARVQDAAGSEQAPAEEPEAPAAARETAADVKSPEPEPDAAPPPKPPRAKVKMASPEDFADTTGVSEVFDDLPDDARIPESHDDEVPPPLPPDELAQVRKDRDQRPTVVDMPQVDLPVAPVRRKKPRFVASFLVRLKDKERLKKFYTKDISTGGMFLKTPLLKKQGDDVEVVLVHPETDQEFHLGGTVVRVESSQEMASRGMAIEFHYLARNREEALLGFIETGVEHLDPPPADPEEGKIETLESAVGMAPESPRALTALGKKLLEEREDIESAVREFEKALSIDADYIPAHRSLETAYALLGQADKAFHHLREVKRLKREHPEKDEEVDV